MAELKLAHEDKIKASHPRSLSLNFNRLLCGGFPHLRSLSQVGNWLVGFLEEGALVCPEIGQIFSVNKGIPDMLLHGDEYHHKKKKKKKKKKKEEEGEVGKKGPAEVELPAGLRQELMPKHVAVSPDGHRRWARKRGLPMDEGYRALGRGMADLIRLCCKWGVPVLTFFAYSTENMSRSKEDVDSFMNWCEMWIKSVAMEKWMRNNVRLSVIGDKSMLPNSLQQVISEAEEALKANTRLHFIIGLSYGGRYDILQACKSVASKVKDGLIQLEDIDQSIFEQELETKCTKFPNPDLHIRTSGELRLSNFMLWQVHFTEFYFANKCFPDFEEADFIEALNSYQKRDRRFGGR
ncbi:unnamed protein product [Ilex paraguariensis]|uniref:Alkyl transferase n=1 Tax=Ilex paraguariensis TaxID=185542 RepID=A0ABC8RBN6_9AQUA